MLDNWVDDSTDITHLACMAHARRPFAQLVKIAKKTGKAHEATSLIRKLYLVEDEIRDLPLEDRYQIRLEKAKPILERIKVWLDKSVRNVPADPTPDTLLLYY